MKKYQVQLLSALRASHWELSEVIEDERWDLLEHWVVYSKREPLELWISFISYDGENYMDPPVNEIRASRGKPVSRLNDDLTISNMSMMKGIYEEKLTKFMDEINNFRKSGKTANEVTP